MDPMTVTAVAAGSRILGGVSAYFGKREQARRLRAETDEILRRRKLAQAQTLGTAKAVGGGSGFEFESEGLQKYYADMAAEFARMNEWTRSAGYRQANDLAGAGKFGLLGDIGGALFSFGQANNWWQEEEE